MTHPNKRRGCDLERELVRWAHENGLDAERAWGSDGRAHGWHKDVDVMLQGMPVQCKRKRALPEWLGMSEHVGAVCLREDRGDRYLVLRLDGKVAEWLKTVGW